MLSNYFGKTEHDFYALVPAYNSAGDYNLNYLHNNRKYLAAL
jgi:hypothetical protein